MTNAVWRRAVEKAADARPDWANGRYEAKGVPTCSGERCHRHDGKRCEALGYHPGRVCEPVVTEMGKLLNAVPVSETSRAATKTEEES